MSLRLCLLAVLLPLAALVPAGAAAAHSYKAPEVVARGLDNPRDLDVSQLGTVYVAEAGRGGSDACVSGEMGETCAGPSGAVTQIRHGDQRRVLKGLPSLAPQPSGDGALGPSDISLREWGGAYVTVGLGQNPDVRDQLGALGPRFGLLYEVSPFGHLRAVADISAYEAANNPDEAAIDSNPNSVTSKWGRIFVVDAGGNSLLQVRRSGEISTVAVFPLRRLVAPPVDVQAVPTNVIVGPDGALYVSQLTGAPFVPGAARIYRVVPGSEPEIYADGLTNVTDLAFDGHGNLYVVEIAANGLGSGDPTGALIKIRPDGSRETVLSAGLVNPYGVAVSPRGDIYVSNHGASAGIGEVLRLKRDHHG